MLASPLRGKAIWILPTVAVIAVLMLLPAGAGIGRNAAPASSTGVQAVAGASSIPAAGPAVGGDRAASTNPFSGSSPTRSASQSSLPLSPGSAKSPQQFSQALDQVAASHPGLAIDGSLNSLASQVAAGKVVPSSVYLPNLNLLESGPQSPTEAVGAGYTANPAPMGIGDFGLESGSPQVKAYSYSSSSFTGSLDLTAANASYPGAYYYIGAPYTSPYDFGIQLNTVTTNVSIPGNNEANLWTQNVVTLNGDTIGLEDNVWNFTSPTLSLYPGTILSGNGIAVYPTLYYDYGPTFPQAFPLIIDLYNNASVVAGHDQVTFGYRIVSGGVVHTGVYDTVVFDNTGAANPNPAFEVSGKTLAPVGLNFDSELIFGGPGGGSNAVFNNISGSETLQYWNAAGASYKSVPSAYDFGTDTGETAIGVAETWSTSDTVGLSAGPSLLYGLWNSQLSTEVGSGSIEIQGTLTTPDWGFVFIGDGGPYYNQSYVPTNAEGGFLTYLPPINSVFPASGFYAIFYLADGYTYTFTNVVTTTVGISEVLTANPGQWAEPLYVNGNAQAQNAASVLTAWTAGPFDFAGLTLLSGLSSGFYAAMFFDHLNDWGYPSFNMFQATGVTDPIVIEDDYQGDSDYLGATGNYYFFDGPVRGTVTTLIGVAPALSFSIPEYSQLIALYSDPLVTVTDQQVYGYFAGSILSSGASPFYSANPAGGAVVLWNDPNANVTDFDGWDGSLGIYVADSPDVSVFDGAGWLGANGVSLVGSNNAKVRLIAGYDSVAWTNKAGTDLPEVSAGVYDENSLGGTFTTLYGEGGGAGFVDFGGVGAAVNDVLSGGASTNISDTSIFYNSFGVVLNGALHTSINDVTAYDDSFGVADGIFGEGSLGTTISDLATTDLGTGFFLVYSDYTNITSPYFYDTDLGGELLGTQNTTFQSTTIYYVDYGVEGFDIANTSFVNTNASEVFDDGLWIGGAYATTLTNFDAEYLIVDWGAFMEDAYHTTFTNVVATDAQGVLLYYGNTVSASGIKATDYSDAALSLEYGSAATISGITANEDSLGVELYEWTGATVTTVATASGALGLEVYYSSGITVSGVSASDSGSLGAYIDETTGVTISNVAASNESEGTELEDVSQGSATTVSATDTSVGIYLGYSNGFTVSKVTASDESIGVWLYESDTISISNVVATDPVLYSPSVNESVWDAPISAIDTEYSEAVQISDVNATTYPAALYDYDSEGLVVSAVNATGGWYGIVFDDTEYSLITQSWFIDDASYGVAIVAYGYDNTVYENHFIGDNGATGTYSPAHVQAFGDDYNQFYMCTDSSCTTGIGNYWSDWHTYGPKGYLAPYPVSGSVFDLFPIGPQETFTVNFVAVGAPTGASWSVTLNGVTETATTATISFTEPIGSYAYQVGSVAGYTLSPASGAVNVTGANYNVSVTFSANLYAVTLSEGGLGSGTTWSATVNGVTQSTSGTSLVFNLPNGKYTYAFNAVSGYNLPSTGATGSVTVNGAPMSVATTYSPTSTPSYVQSGTFNDWFAVALALAVIALVVGLLALFLRRGKEKEPPAAAQPWTPPAASAGGTAAAAPPPSGSSGSWSEGPPPAGGSPPS